MKILNIEYNKCNEINGTNLVELNVSICKNCVISIILPN